MTVCKPANTSSLYTGYDGLEARKEARENAWRHPGWDEVVAYTVPLIKEMHARILVPNYFSPAQ